MLHAERLKAIGERIVQAARLAVQLHLERGVDAGVKTDLQTFSGRAESPGEQLGLSDPCVLALLRQLTGRVTDDTQRPAMRRAG